MQTFVFIDMSKVSKASASKKYIYIYIYMYTYIYGIFQDGWIKTVDRILMINLENIYFLPSPLNLVAYSMHSPHPPQTV